MSMRINRLEMLVWVTVVALSLAVSGFAHRAMPEAQTELAYPAGINIEAYRLPDGSLPDFCLNSGNRQHADTARCDFCTLAHGSAVPSPDAFPVQSARNAGCHDAVTAQVALHQALLPGAPGTGPPSLS